MRHWTVVVAAAAVTAISLFTPLAQAHERSGLDVASHSRSVMSLDRGWRFRFAPLGPAAAEAAYDDSAWSVVDLPHTWNRLGSYQSQRAKDADLRQGSGWYRLKVRLPRSAPGRRQILEFDGVGSVADVWVNGVRVGGHAGAFSRFRLDATDALRPGENLIAVRADNSKPQPDSPTEAVIPLGGDFFIHGGLYRGVRLIQTASVQIDMFDFGGPGVYISTPLVNTAQATVSVRTRLRNTLAQDRALTLATRLVDASGKTVASDSVPVSVDQNAVSEVARVVVLPRPRFWQGRKDPYLYAAIVELREGATVVDRVKESFGVRTFNFDPDNGFSLNGQKLILHGASRHQDVQGQGWALTDNDQARDMAIMAEMGVNTVRHAHYQHAQAWASEADRAGMVVWAEAPFVSQSSLDGGPPSLAVIENAKQQLTELIRQNYNHPSIVLWSVGNEVDLEASTKAFVNGGKGAPAQSLGLLSELNNLAHALDPSRPTTYADCCESTPLQQKGAETLSGVTDVAAFNRYFGWYYGRPKDISAALGAFRRTYKKAPIALSEYGAGGAFSQHTDNPEGGPINAIGRPHPEEYQSWVHEQTWPELQKLPYLSGAWIWAMFDFASASRSEGEGEDLNDKGLVSYDRTRRKDAFYYYKAQWSEAPVLHLTGRRYLERAYPVMDVRAYSNADQARLTLNGRDLGAAPCVDRVCVWPGVRLRAGVNLARVSARFRGRVMNDEVRWTGPDPAAGLAIKAGSLAGLSPAMGQRFGSDNFFVGGSAVALNGGYGRGPARVVEGAQPSALYDAYREGRFTYRLPVPAGTWRLTLHMFEPVAALAETRSFDIVANGRLLASDVKPASIAGGAMRATTLTYTVMVEDHGLILDFNPKGGPAVVAGLQLSVIGADNPH